MSNKQRLTRAIDRLQNERALFLGRVRDLGQRQLDFQATRHSWSIGQIAHHVALSEGVWQSYLKSVLKGGDRENGMILKVSLQEVPFSSRILPDFILKSPFIITPLSLMMNLMPRPLQSMLFAVPIMKMNAGPRMQPKLGQPREQLLKCLGETRKATLDLIAPLEDWDLTRFRIIHPLVGDQDIYGVLELLASHEQRHSQQVDSIRNLSAWPATERQSDTL